MRDFARLVEQLDSSNKNTEKLNFLVQYLSKANDTDLTWAVAILTGRKIKRPITTTQMRQFAAEAAKIDLWLFEESYHVVGDLAETIALLVNPSSPKLVLNSLTECIHLLLKLKNEDEELQKSTIIDIWKSIDYYEKFVFNKLITGGFRIGVSQKTIEKALAIVFEKDENAVAHLLMGNWNPETQLLKDIIEIATDYQDISRPYPFCLAYPFENETELIDTPENWIAEWKWDGIRGQIIHRNNEVFIWSRGEELITDKFPELAGAAKLLPNGTVLDGEILIMKNGIPQAFQTLQTRIGRKSISAKMLKEIPAGFIAYDVLEFEGNDLRNQTQIFRKHQLKEIIETINSDILIEKSYHEFNNMDELAALRIDAKSVKSEGLMIKRKDAIYGTGRKRGIWYKWKLQAKTIDAVMIYAQKGHGRRANLYTDYTFAVWHENQLVPVTKAYSGLTDNEIKQVDDFVKKNTLERFGPVRSVKPKIVMEIAFEGINFSNRHKSGVALRFPRISRLRLDKKPEEADSLDQLKSLIET